MIGDDRPLTYFVPLILKRQPFEFAFVPDFFSSTTRLLTLSVPKIQRDRKPYLNLPLLHQKHRGLRHRNEGHQEHSGHSSTQPQHRREGQHITSDIHHQVAQVLGQDEQGAERAADIV